MKEMTVEISARLALDGNSSYTDAVAELKRWLTEEYAEAWPWFRVVDLATDEDLEPEMEEWEVAA